MKRITRLPGALAPVTLLCLCCARTEAQGVKPPADDSNPPRLVSVRVAAPPVLDGKGDDVAWRVAAPLPVATKVIQGTGEEPDPKLVIRSAHTDTHLYFLVSWEDATASVTHKPWVWNQKTKAYGAAQDEEDVLALAFEHTGPWNPNMRARLERTWDVWHWKAYRTNRHGYAMDRTHVYTKEKPATGKATQYPTIDGGEIFIARPEDRGDSVERKQPAPAQFAGERVPQYLPGAPTGSAADIRARGTWEKGRWTVELARRLNTGHADDTAFDTARPYRMAASVFDHSEFTHFVTGTVLLTFNAPPLASRPASSPLVLDFEKDTPGKAPSGFTAVRTGPGRPGRWVVQQTADAPSGRKALAQTDADKTRNRFPLCVHNGFTARDVELSVRFKPVSGTVDQAAGLVWRFQDKNNYYLVRANALEDNVVLYKVQNGRRTDLPLKGEGRTYGKKVVVPARQWSTLAVTAKGTTFEVSLNGQRLFVVEDATFAEAGRVGVWTKADSVTYFDDLKAKRLDTRERVLP